MPITLFLNQRSGSVSEETVQKLHALLGADLRIEDVAQDSLCERVRKAVEEGRRVVAGGGDGTIAAVAGCLVGTKEPLGILPLGTLNHFARDLHIPMELGVAAQVIIEGREPRIDTGCVNDRAFINNSALGLYPRLVLYRESLERKGVPRWAALCSAAFYILSRYRTMHVEFEIEGRRTVRKTPLVFVGNSIYTLKGISAGSRESLCDGVLTVVIAREQSAWAFLKGMLKALAGMVENNDSLEVLHLTSLTVRPRSRTAVVSTDGEVAVLETPLKYCVRPHSLTVLTPTA